MNTSELNGRFELINTVLSHLIVKAMGPGDEGEDFMGKIAFDWPIHHLNEEEKKGWVLQQKALLHQLSGFYGRAPLGGRTADEL